MLHLPLVSIYCSSENGVEYHPDPDISSNFAITWKKITPNIKSYYQYHKGKYEDSKNAKGFLRNPVDLKPWAIFKKHALSTYAEEETTQMHYL